MTRQPFWRTPPADHVDRYRDLPDGARWTSVRYRWGIIFYGLGGVLLAFRWSGRWMDGRRFECHPSALWTKAWIGRP